MFKTAQAERAPTEIGQHAAFGYPVSRDGVPAVSIVVNSFNPHGDPRIRSMTELALRCYRAFTAADHELILVDGNGDPDQKLAGVCAELGYRYLTTGKRLTFGEGYNAGIRASAGDWIVLSASDIFVVDGWLDALLVAAKQTGAWMTAPYLSVSDCPAQRRSSVFALRTFTPSFVTFNLNLVTRHCIETVGLIDEQFLGAYNDMDYVLRIRAHGGEIALTDCGEITHLGRGTLGEKGIPPLLVHDYPLFKAKWPGVWDEKAEMLRTPDAWSRFLRALERFVPRRWRRHYHANRHRFDPWFAPRAKIAAPPSHSPPVVPSSTPPATTSLLERSRLGEAV